MRDRIRSSLRGQALPAFSALTSLLVLGVLAGGVHVPLPPSPRSSMAATVVYVPAGAHASGANGASWRTDVEVHNPGTATASFTIQLLQRDANNASPQSKSYTLGAQQSRRFTDALMSEFAFDGAAALRFTVSSGSLVVTSRTYNLVGSNPWSLPEGSSFGQFEPGFAESDAIAYGQEGRLIQLTQQPSSSLNGFRTNVGLVNTTAGSIDARVDCYRSDGTFLGTATANLPAYGFKQLNEVFGQWGSVDDAYAIVKTTTAGGGLFAFATVIDNHNSGDPVFVPAFRLASGGATPTPTATPTTTATPTRTPTPTPTTPAGGKPNLYLFQPSGWSKCFSAHYQSGCCTDSSCCPPFLSTFYGTYFQMFVANSGQARATGTVRFSMAIDGTIVGYANWPNSSGLDPGYGIVLSWQYTNTVAAGTHTLTMTVDPDNTIAESNESDNSCSISATWTSIVLGRGDARAQAAPREDRITFGEPFRLADAEEAAPPSSAAPLAAAPVPVYIPAAAHAAGMNGANWRTDVEVHNPGTTAVSFQIALLPQATDNSAGSPTRTFSIGPQQSVRYVDVLSSVFGTSGAAAIRVTPQSGTILVNSRTYNLVGANSVGLPVGASFGQYVPGIEETSAIGYGEEGRIVMLTHRDSSSYADFRTNVGFVNTTSTPIDLRIDLFRANGTLLGTIQNASTHLRGYEFQQIASIFGAYATWVDDGYAVLRTTTSGGRFFAFATVIDNHLTGDPIFIPATKLPGSALPTPTPTGTSTPTATPTPTPTPPGGVVQGPGGTSIALPSGASTTGGVVTIASDPGTGLAATGETLVSSAIALTVTGTEPLVGNGSFALTIPVTGTVSDPSKLLLKVMLADGTPYPVTGVYDSSAKKLTVQLMSLWNGWKMAVVSRTDLTTIGPFTDPHEPVTLGWETPDDWKTCAFVVKNEAPATNPVPAAFATSTLPTAMTKVCSILRTGGFKSPKLFLDTRLSPNARVVHLVRGVKQAGGPDPIGSHFEPCWNPGDPACDEESSAFTTSGLTEDQMLALGQIFINYDEIQNLAAAKNVTLENVASHELFHAVQMGYDFRKRIDGTGNTPKAYSEGTATILGHTVQQNPNDILGGEVYVRPWAKPLPLDERLDDFTTNYYQREDFFAYVAKRFSGGNLTTLGWLFQAMSDQTNGKFGLSHEDYLTEYRRAAEFWLTNQFSKGLSQVYGDFVLDRAYKHPAYARLRDSEQTRASNSFDPSVFKAVPTWDQTTQPSYAFAALPPLTAATAVIAIPNAARTAGSLSFSIAVSGAPLAANGVRITVFREKSGVMAATQGEIDVTDVTTPLSIPIDNNVDALRIFVWNSSVEKQTATVTLGGGFTRFSVGHTHYTYVCHIANCYDTCSEGSATGNVSWATPLVWNGDAFSLDVPGVHIEGRLSADKKTLLSYSNTLFGVVSDSWVNLPLDTARSTADTNVYALAGSAAQGHSLVAVPVLLCDSSEFYGVDFSKDVLLEIWLSK